MRLFGNYSLCNGCATDGWYGHVAQAPLQEGVEQLEIVKSEALQDKWLIHYLQHEVAKFKVLEDVKVKDLGVHYEHCVWRDA